MALLGQNVTQVLLLVLDALVFSIQLPYYIFPFVTSCLHSNMQIIFVHFAGE